MEFRIQMISAPETHALRHKVLRPHEALENCVYPEDELPASFHVGAFFRDQMIGTASFHEQSFPDLRSERPYRLRGMAVDPGFRRMKIGHKLLEKGFEALAEKNCDLLWCNAREIAFPFYESLGFQFLGPLFEIPGLGPHKVMYKHFR